MLINIVGLKLLSSEGSASKVGFLKVPYTDMKYSLANKGILLSATRLTV